MFREVPHNNWNRISGVLENIYSGVRQAFETNAASRPWMQLDMGEEVTVKKVKSIDRLWWWW